ncbi:MAG: cupin domain-containing protein [Gemmataceae bacterium]
MDEVRAARYFPQPGDLKRHTIFPGVHIATSWLDRLMLSLVDMEPHSVVPEHSHPHEQMGIVLDGEALFTIAGVQRHVRKGDLYRIPSGTVHTVTALATGFRALDVFSPPREEYQ